MSKVAKKMQNNEAERFAKVLEELSNSDKDLPVEVGFRILQNTQEIKSAAALYQTELSNIIRKYAKDGETVKREDDPEAFDECKKKIDELGKIEILVDINELTMAQVSGLSLPMKHMRALSFMVAQEGGAEDGTAEGSQQHKLGERAI